VRSNYEGSAAILLTGSYGGYVSIYRTPLSHIHPVQFELLKCFSAHPCAVNALSMHPTKPMFVSAGDDTAVKIWNINDITSPVVIKCIMHSDRVICAKYSQESNLLLTGCDDGMLCVYGVEPLCSVRWRCKLPGDICSVAWSPSNRIAASFRIRSHTDTLFGVQVWDSTFHTLFKHHDQGGALAENCGLSFPSDELLICSGYLSQKFYSYNIPKSKVTVYACDSFVWAVTALSSEIVCISYTGEMLRVYKIHGCQLQLLATLPFGRCTSLSSCAYPYNNAGYILASAHYNMVNVHISVTSRFNRYWVQEVTKIILDSDVLPFCVDVHKIILKYVR